jgi:hypothetical protein
MKTTLKKLEQSIPRSLSGESRILLGNQDGGSLPSSRYARFTALMNLGGRFPKVNFRAACRLKANGTTP